MDTVNTIISFVNDLGPNAAPAVCATFALAICLGLIGGYIACQRHDAKLGLTS